MTTVNEYGYLEWTEPMNRRLRELYDPVALASASPTPHADKAVLIEVCTALRSDPLFRSNARMIIPSRVRGQLEKLLGLPSSRRQQLASTPPPPPPSAPLPTIDVDVLPAARATAPAAQTPAQTAPVAEEEAPPRRRPQQNLEVGALAMANEAFRSIDGRLQSLAAEVAGLTGGIAALNQRLDNLFARLESLRVGVFDELATVSQRLAPLERAYRLMSAIYRQLTGRDELDPSPEVATAVAPTPATSVGAPEEVVEDTTPLLAQPVVTVDPNTEPARTAESGPEEDFHARFSGKRLGILGGTYDLHQVTRLRTRLKVVVDKDLWLGGGPMLIQSKLESLLWGKVDLLLFFNPGLGSGQYQTARSLAKKYQVPTVVTEVFDPRQVAMAFLATATGASSVTVEKR